MHIPRELPQYTDTNLLLVVAGAQTARFFMAHGGDIVELDSIRIENPEYSDREGFFLRRGGGKTYGSGSVYEAKEAPVQHAFVRNLTASLKHIQGAYPVDEIVVCVPDYEKNIVQETFPASLKKKISETKLGNYTKDDGIEVLRRVVKDQAPAGNPATGEAKQILEKTEDIPGH